MDELELPPMVVNNEDPKGTAFSVSVDATKEHGKIDMSSEDIVVAFFPSVQTHSIQNISLQVLQLELVPLTERKRV